ncbi:MAG: Uncharacterised protein [Alphaproteobacteria bacterium UBA4588]|nr:MAG: Uncharacterised protein [Alphaproteobacteria bacterium UBA4588]
MRKLRALCYVCLLLVGSGMARANNISTTLEGVWFTCEFTQSQTPPDDDCQTFDDEGFRFSDGTATYLRMLGSEETNCKGGKKGQCFPRSTPEISVSTRSLGKITYGQDWIDIHYLFCTQRFYTKASEHFITLIPNEPRCLWAGKRHFYIAPFTGTIIHE